MKASPSLAYGCALLLVFLGLFLSPPVAAQTCAGLDGRDLECCYAYPSNDDQRACCQAGLIDTNPAMTPEEETNCDCYRSGDGGPKINCFSCIAPQQVADLKLLLKINQAMLAPMNITITEDATAGKMTLAFDETTPGGPTTRKSFEMTLCPCETPQGQARFVCPADWMGSILCMSCIHPKQIEDVVGPTAKPYFQAPPSLSLDSEFGCYRIDGLQFGDDEESLNICLPKCDCEGPACPTTTEPQSPPVTTPSPETSELPFLVCREGEREAYLSTTGARVTLEQNCPVYPSFKLTEAPSGLRTLSEAMAGVVRTGQWNVETRDLSYQYLESALQEKGSFASAGIKGISLAGYKTVEIPIDQIAQKLLTSDGKLLKKEEGLIEIPPVSTTPAPASLQATRISAAAGLKILTDRIKQAPSGLTVGPGSEADALLITAIRFHSEGAGGGCSLAPKD